LFPLVLAVSGLPVFGWARPVPVSLRGVPNPRRANFLVSAAGPVSNLILAVASAAAILAIRGVALTGSNPLGLLRPLFEIARASLYVNVALAVFNLVPIPPLD